MANTTKTAGSSLNNFGVFTGANKVEQALQHPIQKFRFTVSLNGFGSNVGTGKQIRYNTNTISLPKWENNIVTIHGGNSETHITGKWKYNTFQLDVKDPIDGSVEAEIENQKAKQANPYTTAVATVASNEKFTTIIDFHNGGGTPLVTWEIVGCLLVDADYGSFDYSSSDPKNVILTIQPDNMLAYKNCTSIGTAQGGIIIDDYNNTTLDTTLDKILAVNPTM